MRWALTVALQDPMAAQSQPLPSQMVTEIKAEPMELPISASLLPMAPVPIGTLRSAAAHGAVAEPAEQGRNDQGPSAAHATRADPAPISPSELPLPNKLRGAACDKRRAMFSGLHMPLAANRPDRGLHSKMCETQTLGIRQAQMGVTDRAARA